MTWRGPWDGPWDGGWEGAGEPVAPGAMAATLAGSGALTGTLEAQQGDASRVAGDYDEKRSRRTFGIPRPWQERLPVYAEMAAFLAGSGAMAATGATRKRARVIELPRASVARFDGITAKTDAAAVRALWLRQVDADRQSRLLAQIEAHQRRLMEEDELWLMVA